MYVNLSGYFTICIIHVTRNVSLASVGFI